MKFITVSELRDQTSKIITGIETTKKGVIVTKNGKPVVYMRPVREEELLMKEELKGGDKSGKGPIQKK